MSEYSNGNIEKILISEDEIANAVSKLGMQITKDYAEKNLLLIVILKGSLVFAADLMRCIHLPLILDFVQASSYGSGTVSSGELKMEKDFTENVSGKDILIIEDIVDSGNTLSAIKEHFKKTDASSVKICTLLSKPKRREIDIEVEYIGINIPDEFVVGYGLDFDQKYRNLPYIGVLKREIYE